MKVPLLDLKAQYAPLKEEIEAAVLATLDEQAFILGSRVRELERAIADHVGVPHAIGCASGSDALLLALMALEIGPGDEVITTPYSFFATAGCIARLGARPVFVDIDIQTFNIDAEVVEAAITPRTKALIPVHLFGQCADMDALCEIAEKHGVPIVEDAAQALGARWGERSAGSFGLVGCFSFYPSKNLGGAGDGGMLTTHDPDFDGRLRALRTHGGARKYQYDFVGANSRLDALQAAILSVKLPHLDRWQAARQHNAYLYHGICEARGMLGKVRLPVQRAKASHVFNQFVVRVPRRDELRAFLGSRGIGTEVYYPKSLHEQPCFSGLGHGPGDFPRSEEAARSTLALPVFPELTEEQLQYVVSNIAEFYSV